MTEYVPPPLTDEQLAACGVVVTLNDDGPPAEPKPLVSETIDFPEEIGNA